MAITVVNLETAVIAFDELCNYYLKDTDVDILAPAIVAKYFDEPIDEALDMWLHVSQDELDDNLKAVKAEVEEDPALCALHDLLYETYQTFGHLGLILRVVLLDRHGNLLVQTEEIDDDSYRFHIDSKDRIVQHIRYGYFRN